jgi:hypothetical protein
MKLDETVITQIMGTLGLEGIHALYRYLYNLDLTIKPADSSQSTLVENNNFTDLKK